MMKKQKNSPISWGTVRGVPVRDRLRFSLREDHIETGSGLARREYYFLRLEPRNMDILSPEERRSEYRQMQSVLDLNGAAPSFMTLDKTEGLDSTRQYYETLQEQHPEYEHIYGALLQYLSGMEAAESGNVERAHYMILRCKNRSEFAQFDTVAKTCLSYHIADRAELLVMLKNFLLRDYTPTVLADWDKEIRLKFDAAMTVAQTRRQKKNRILPEEQTVADEETMRLLLPSALRFDSRYIQQGALYRRVLRVRGYPAELAHASALHELGALAGTTLRIYLEPISTQQTNAMLTRQINQRTATMLGARKASDRVRSGVEKNLVEDAYKGQLQRQSKMYYVSIFIEVYGDSQEELKAKAETVRSLLAAQGMIADEMYFEQREGFVSMLPFGVNLADTFKRNMPTGTIAALYPQSASRKVDSHGFLLGKTSAGNPFIFDPTLRTADITNGVILIAGQSGQGKSYLQKKILTQAVAQGYTVYTLDAENEYIEPTANMGGTNQFCAGGGVKINPLEVRRLAHKQTEREFVANEADDPAAFSAESPLLQHLSWLSAFHRLLFPSLTEPQYATLAELTRQHYTALGITANFNPEGKPPTVYPTYSTLYDYIEGIYDRFDTETEGNKLFDREDVRQLLLSMASVKEGAYSAVFNGYTNVRTAGFINFVVSDLLSGDANLRDAALFNILSWIWNRVVTYRQRLLFAVDELYLYLNPIVVEYLRNFAKRARKYEACMLMTTQNLSDFADPAITHMCQPLFELAIHKFLFYPGDVNRDYMKKLLQLSDSELDCISVSRQRHCLAKCGAEKYSLRIGTLSYEDALFGAGGGR